MKSVLILFSLGFSIVLSSCSEESGNGAYKEINEESTSPGVQNLISESEVTITINDYIEEAISIKSEAEEIILRAEEINCAEAKKIAESVILISAKAERGTNLVRVEHYIEEASQQLFHAEDAIVYCEEKIE